MPEIKKKEYVILVDKNNKPIGREEKMQAHKDAKLHRAFSLFVFNEEGELLLQRRAKTKYHCGGMWANTCCSHPRPKETYQEAIHRRLQEEMGFDCPLEESFCFLYKEKLDNDLTEHEYDCVFVGKVNSLLFIKPNPQEVEEYAWVDLENLEKEMIQKPEKYTVWLKIALQEAKKRKIVWCS